MYVCGSGSGCLPGQRRIDEGGQRLGDALVLVRDLRTRVHRSLLRRFVPTVFLAVAELGRVDGDEEPCTPRGLSFLDHSLGLFSVRVHIELEEEGLFRELRGCHVLEGSTRQRGHHEDDAFRPSGLGPSHLAVSMAEATHGHGAQKDRHLAPVAEDAGGGVDLGLRLGAETDEYYCSTMTYERESAALALSACGEAEEPVQVWAL